MLFSYIDVSTLKYRSRQYDTAWIMEMVGKFRLPVPMPGLTKACMPEMKFDKRTLCYLARLKITKGGNADDFYNR